LQDDRQYAVIEVAVGFVSLWLFGRFKAIAALAPLRGLFSLLCRRRSSKKLKAAAVASVCSAAAKRETFFSRVLYACVAAVVQYRGFEDIFEF